MDDKVKRYLVFWISQSVSQLGSAMTGIALVLWAYQEHGSALTVSLMTFCNYVPYILASLFAGTVIDWHSKKGVILLADSLAAVGTWIAWALVHSGNLQVWHIYLMNGLMGVTNAFQSPASSVAVGKMVPKERLANISGLKSFSENLVMVLAPVLAAGIYSLAGLDAGKGVCGAECHSAQHDPTGDFAGRVSGRLRI